MKPKYSLSDYIWAYENRKARYYPPMSFTVTTNSSTKELKEKVTDAIKKATQYGHYQTNMSSHKGYEFIICRCDSEARRMDNQDYLIGYFEKYTGKQWISLYGYYIRDFTNCCKNIEDVFEILDIFERQATIKGALDYLSKTRFINNYYHLSSVPVMTHIYEITDWILRVLEGIEDVIDIEEDKEVDKMSLKIKKTDVMNIGEFEKNTKAYDVIVLKIDKKKYDEFKKEYGINLCRYDNIVGGFTLSTGTIEFLPKAIVFGGNSIPYDWITEVEGTYFLSTE